jgi:hypothetical protein
MNARLGFAIAAHLDPEVLIIDEVLAVGDFSFQDRAFGRIRDMVRSGIPVVIVSHQLDRVASLCTKAMVLGHGKVMATGTASHCIAEYVKGVTVQRLDEGSGPVRIDAVTLLDDVEASPGDRVTLRVAGEVLERLEPSVDPMVVRVRATHWHDIVSYEIGSRGFGIALPVRGQFEAEIELQLNLSPGVYRVDVLPLDTAMHVDLPGGASTYVRVTDGSPTFGGGAHLDARMRLRAPAALHAGAAAGAPAVALAAPVR